MAWSDLASNQMVSFTDAQTSGFSLKSGQSHVTSNQCMTSSDITTKYYVTVSGYSGNQLVPKSAWTGSSYAYNFGTPYSTGLSACTFVFGRNRFSNVANLNVGSIIYTDAALTAPFNGGNNWFPVEGYNVSFQINASGSIINLYDCMY